MPVKVVLSEYLDQLKETEKSKPVHERRPIPTVEEFASKAGVSKTGFIDFTHNRTRGINRVITTGVIELLRDCGFDTDIPDIIKYVPK